MTTRMLRALALLLLLLQLPAPATAWYPRLARQMLIEDGTRLVGQNRDYITAPGETLMEIARRARIGYDNLLRANPGIDPWEPPVGARLILPLAALLPENLQPGITINLAELRLYLLWDEDGVRKIRIYPIGIGREGWETPLGNFAVKVVIDQPLWTPPASLRLEKPDLPGSVPPGPDNPLGSYWIGLTADGVGIHGTNQPYGVGRRVSHGCIRLYPKDIVDLAARVVPGTPVRIVDQPVKQAVIGGKLYLEVHRPVTLDDAGLVLEGWDRQAAERVLREARGIPMVVPAEP